MKDHPDMNELLYEMDNHIEQLKQVIGDEDEEEKDTEKDNDEEPKAKTKEGENSLLKIALVSIGAAVLLAGGFLLLKHRRL